jgi:alkylhydroperoxidase family enzyme
VVAEGDATGATSQMYQTERTRVGYLPRYAIAFGARPEVYRSWQGLSSAISSPMPPRRYELVTLAVARRLRSSYCSLAHGAILAEQHLSAIEVAQPGRSQP